MYFWRVSPSYQSVYQQKNFYGRTGYAPTSGTYTWNEAGLLNSDSSRGILSTTYNHLGLPVRQVYKTGATTSALNNYTYSADGTLLRITNPAIGTLRDYSGPLTMIQDLTGRPAHGQRNYLPIRFEGYKSAHSINTIIDAYKR